MKMNTLAIAAGTVAIAGAATADFTGSYLVNMGDLGAGVDSWRVYMSFNSPVDRLLGISGNAAVSALFYQSTTAYGIPTTEALAQRAGGFDGLALEDVPHVFDFGGDSWVTIGRDTFIGLNVGFSAGFAGGDGTTSVINGSSWGHADNGGYFNGDPSNGDGDGGFVLIAQFSVSNFEFGGTVDYTTDGSSVVSEAFYVTTLVLPTPGALAMFGVAGLAAGRRRR